MQLRSAQIATVRSAVKTIKLNTIRTLLVNINFQHATIAIYN